MKGVHLYLVEGDTELHLGEIVSSGYKSKWPFSGSLLFTLRSEAVLIAGTYKQLAIRFERGSGYVFNAFIKESSPGKIKVNLTGPVKTVHQTKEKHEPDSNSRPNGPLPVLRHA